MLVGKMSSGTTRLNGCGEGSGKTVEQRQRIAVAEPADENAAVAIVAEAGHAAQCAGDVAFPGARNLFRGQDRDDLARGAGQIARTALAGDDDQIAAGDRNLRLVERFLLLGVVDAGDLVGQDFGLPFARLGAAIGARARWPARALSERGRRAKRAGDEKQGGQLRGCGHGESPRSENAAGSGPAIQRRRGRTRHRRQVVGSEVQAPVLSSSKDRVAVLQVQPSNRSSLPSSTAPT